MKEMSYSRNTDINSCINFLFFDFRLDRLVLCCEFLTVLA